MTTLTEAQMRRFEERFGNWPGWENLDKEGRWIIARNGYTAACEDAEGLVRQLGCAIEVIQEMKRKRPFNHVLEAKLISMDATLKAWRGDD